MIQTIKDLVSAKADTTVALAKEIWGYAELSMLEYKSTAAYVELMKKADINCVSVGIFSWAHLEPSEGEYDFDWLEKIIDNLYKNGIYTVLATPSGAKPLWMSEKYEEIRRVQNNGVRDLSGARQSGRRRHHRRRQQLRAGLVA